MHSTCPSFELYSYLSFLQSPAWKNLRVDTQIKTATGILMVCLIGTLMTSVHADVASSAPCPDQALNRAEFDFAFSTGTFPQFSPYLERWVAVGSITDL